MILAASLSVLFAAVPVVADKVNHSVTFTARATDVTKGATIEFAFAGPGSDRAYETMFLTDASVTEIAKAFDEAGIPRGKSVSPSVCRFWPAGANVTVEPSIWSFIDDNQNEREKSFCYTGGCRDNLGDPTANTNMPSAVFALFSIDQSLILSDNATDQSSVYGRFSCNGTAEKGKRYSFKVTLDEKAGTTFKKITIEPGNIKEVIASLKDNRSDLDVLPNFSPELTVAEARAAATALSVIDSRKIRINGFEEGQFFYRAFLPDEKWRDRQKRLTQPVEVHISETNAVYTIIDEDWSVEGIDPKLTPHDELLDDVVAKFKGDSCLFFATADMKLRQIYAIARDLPKSIRNWYVFID